MNIFIIVILSVLCIVLLFYIYYMKRKIKELLLFLNAIEIGKSQKLFTKSQGIIRDVIFKVNKLVENYESEIIELKKMEKASNELLTSLSHDVRTPLTSLLGYLDALESKIVVGIEQEEYIHIARKKAYDLKWFVDMLFDWFKIGSKEMQFTMKPIDINELTREILIDWLPILEQKNILLEIYIPDEEYILNIDNSAYKRIISNIIQNAIEHSLCNCLKIIIKHVEKLVNIIIQDNGIGISLDKLPYVFDRLYKCDKARCKKNSGLGLCIAKELTQMHNGTINVDSNLGELTTFIIAIPRLNIPPD